MANENEKVAAEPPRFKVRQAPGFATGLRFYQPDEEVVWRKPDGWDDAKYGKHFTDYGPSTTFEPLNEPAKKMLAAHLDRLAKSQVPVVKEDKRDKQISDLLEAVRLLVSKK